MMSDSEGEEAFASADEDESAVHPAKGDNSQNESIAGGGKDKETKSSKCEKKKNNAEVSDSDVVKSGEVKNTSASNETDSEKSDSRVNLVDDERNKTEVKTRERKRCETDDDKESEAKASEKDPKAILDDLAGTESEGWRWNSFSNWGSSMINTAASSVSTFTNQVGTGINQVLQTVETGFESEETKPVPEEDNNEQSDLQNKVITTQITKTSENENAEKANKENKVEEKKESENWFSSWGISSIGDVVNKTTSAVQLTVNQTTSASKKVVVGGLDVLESIGKKTFDILTEGDHGLKKVIERNRASKPNLSLLLREAKEEAETRVKEEEEFLESRKAHFGAQFDDNQGLVQLEALELLSNTSEGQLKKLLNACSEETLNELQTLLADIKDIFNATTYDSDNASVEEGHDFGKLLLDYKGQQCQSISVQKLEQTNSETEAWFENKDDNDMEPKDIHAKAIQSLAKLTAFTIEHYHKCGLLLLQDSSPSTSSRYASIAKALSSLTTSVCSELVSLSQKFVKALSLIKKSNDEDENSSVTEISTNVYFESSNSCAYVSDAFQLLLPLLQLTAIKTHPICKDLLTDN